VNWLKSMSWKKRIGLGAGSFFLLLVVLFGVAYALTSVPNPNKIATAQATQVQYADGTSMGRIGKNRQIVPLAKMSIDAQHAILAAEDRGFYSEPGISPKGILRALFTNVKGGGVSQGGSTITQQYAKNAFLTQERTYTRKVKEVFISLKMSQTVSKDKILEDYLNTIYFGRGAYGLQAAAETYFAVPASALNAAQSAVLASSIRSPAGYDPTKHPERAKERWAYVLSGMVKQKWLTADAKSALTYPTIAKARTTSFPGPLDYVRDQITAELEKQGFTEDRLSAGGLIVRTTIQKNPQKAAQNAVEALVSAPSADPKANAVVGALVAVQPGTGKVIAYYGGRDAGGFDYASGGKGVQPGSSMKPYVLAAALEQNISLSTTFNGASHQDICGQKDVKNDAGDPPFGQIDLATALQHSVNAVYVQLACKVGPAKVVEAARAAGIPDSDPLDGDTGKPTQQIALGSGGYEIHPIDQAAGYATFAAKGKQATPYFVTKVTDLSGNEVYAAKEHVSDAFSAGVAADTTFAMQKVVQGGTGSRAQLDGRPTAGKTGTTSNNQNAWFAGFTPQLSTAVWLGNRNGGKLTVPGTTDGVYGGTLPAKIFKAFMEAALAGQPVQDFPPRANVGAPATPTVTSTPTPSATPSATPTPGTPSPTPSPLATLPPVLETTPPPPTASSPSASPSPPPPAQTAQPAATP
jgi:membrane peptidoglycan carboxypeptidase